MRKCPPGVICIENITIIIIFIVIGIVIYLVYLNINNHNRDNKEIIINNTSHIDRDRFRLIPNYPYNNNNIPENVLQNPYAPPLSDDRYFIRQRIPINVATNVGAVDTEYRQLGILTPLNGTNKDNILPLMGRPLFVNRQKYQYYTISNQHNNVKLPVSVKGRSGTNEYGVDQVFNGDTVYIEGYNSAFKVTIYDTDTIKYLPFL
jgi:hypothetical protein